MEGRYEGRSYLSKQIDDAVANRQTDELLGMLIKQAYNVRYFDGTTEHLKDLVEREVRAFTTKLIADWLRNNEDEMREAIESRLTEAHIKPMAVAITDEFIEDVAKGRK